MTGPYHCSKCDQTHKSGAKFEAHKQFATQGAPVKQAKKTSTPVQPQGHSTGTISTVDHAIEARVARIEDQLREVTRQLVSLRDMVMKSIEAGPEITCESVLAAAKRMSSGRLTPLDDLRRVVNPSNNDVVDRQLRDCLVQLMEQNKIILQEMAGSYQVKVRTDVFGGFKA